MSVEATTNLATWDFASKHVQNNLQGGDFIGSHSTIICATAPRASDLAGGFKDYGYDQGDGSTTGSAAYAIPIGVIDSAGVQQDRQLAQIFEIGSTRSYIMSARTMTQLSINRVMYKGPNLLRTLYAYYPTNHDSWQGTENEYRDNEKLEGSAHGTQPIQMGNPDQYNQGFKTIPGYNNFWMNLASDVFSHPMGLVIFWKDNDHRDVAAVYLEECYIQNHMMNISANSVIVAEGCSIRCDRVLPIKVNVRVGSYQSSTTESRVNRTQSQA